MVNLGAKVKPVQAATWVRRIQVWNLLLHNPVFLTIPIPLFDGLAFVV